MRKKLFTLLVGVVAGSAALLAVPAAAASASTAAVPIVQDQVVIYQHADYNTEITRRSIATCTAAGDYWQLNLLDASRISSVLLWVPNPTGTRCNRMAIQSADGPWYSVCINKHQWGIPHFGDVPVDYNDNTWMVWVGRDPRCPSWNA